MAERVPFDTWARFYDTTLPGDRPDRPFFLQFCRDREAPVLELGCGTGDIYLDLLEEDINAYGIDISNEMLSVLRRKASQRGLEAQVTQANITNFSFDVTFETIIGPLNIIRHVVSLDDQRAVFCNVYDALASGGEFAFWVDLPDLDELCEQRDGERTIQRFEHDGREYELEIRIELSDTIEQTVTYMFEYTDIESGERVASMEFEMALVPKQQFDLLLDDAGFSEWTYYNGPELNPLTSSHEPVICAVLNRGTVSG